MSLGTLFLEALSTGVITRSEVNWVTAQQNTFNRTEEAAAQRLGRLIDQGCIQLGNRTSKKTGNFQGIKSSNIGMAHGGSSFP